MKQTVIEANIRQALISMAFRYDIDGDPHDPIFKEMRPQGSREFREVWDRDYSLDQLPRRPRETPFGWINEAEKHK